MNKVNRKLSDKFIQITPSSKGGIRVRVKELREIDERNICASFYAEGIPFNRKEIKKLRYIADKISSTKKK